ncbi:Vacuolar protein sorting-associated protein 35 [Penicillium expansum]|nr:Vacuolar protein sorting-associated protein 35 [Penicillium expansum]
MITVGTVYMSVEDAPVKEIMKDMMEMSRGVQHPIRGLFLRYYLSGQARDYLPSGTGDGPEGNMQDSINFVLTNFVEMNKLWVRLQHQGPSRERDRRIQERRELELLVGSNIVRLSQLVDLEGYKSGILQALLEQVVQCRDVLAQEYLLEVITKVFPDEFHLHTLDLLLSAIARLNPHVDMKKIVIGLMDRLSSYAAREADSTVEPEVRKQSEEEAVTKLLQKLELAKETKAEEPKDASTDDSSKENGTENGEEETSKETPEPAEPPTEEKQVENGDDSKSGIPSEIKLYDIFYDQVVNLIRTRALPIQDTMALLVSLVNLALNTYPDRLEYVDQVLDFATQKTAEYTDHADLHSAPTQQHILHLLNAPLKSYISIFTALALPHYLPLLTSQSYPTRRAVAGEVIRSLLKNKILVSTTENLDRVLQAARASDNDTQLKLLQATRKALADGNERIRYTTPAIITASIRLARKLKSREHYDDNWQSQSSALYRFMHQSINNLYQRVNPGCADLALRLFVMCGEVADQTGFEEVSYEFFAQAFTIYEDAISDSRAQFQAVCIISGALHGSRGFSKENYDTLITKAALHGSKLLKKPDQCRAVYLASHLWWVVENPQREEDDPKDLYRDGKRVLECLQRALRVADACMDTAVSVELFVEILNRYVYYFDQQNETVTTKYLNGLIELIHSNLQTNEDEANANLDGPKTPLPTHVGVHSLSRIRRHCDRTTKVIARWDTPPGELQEALYVMWHVRFLL